MTKLILLFACCIIGNYVNAQLCKNTPLDCPVQYYLEADRMDDSIQRLGNPVIPQEVALEYRLRDITKDILSQLVQKENWDEPLLLEEGGSSGYRAADESALSFPLRPPHAYTLTWQIIVNKDSLDAWSEWAKDFTEKRMSEFSAYTNNVNDPNSKAKLYIDSAMYYRDQETDYITKHAEAYQKALMSNDKAGIATYEKATKAYDKKINDCIAKEKQASGEDQYAKKNNVNSVERESKTTLFRDGTVINVEFEFNYETPPISFDQFEILRNTANTPTPVSFYQSYFNREASRLVNGTTYKQSKNICWLILGDSYTTSNGHRAAGFGKDKKNTDKISIKKIKSDQIQSITVIISGNHKGINTTISDLNWSALGRMIVRNN